ncbi:MAG: hypothetical protein F6K10_18160 [Moorea sp. SIO2B7]|nr:hypothetical protein [Moorena sp. SIO2B7]
MPTKAHFFSELSIKETPLFPTVEEVISCQDGNNLKPGRTNYHIKPTRGNYDEVRRNLD